MPVAMISRSPQSIEFSELPKVAVAGVPGSGSEVCLKLLKAGAEFLLIKESEG